MGMVSLRPNANIDNKPELFRVYRTSFTDLMKGCQNHLFMAERVDNSSGITQFRSLDVGNSIWRLLPKLKQTQIREKSKEFSVYTRPKTFVVAY